MISSARDAAFSIIVGSDLLDCATERFLIEILALRMLVFGKSLREGVEDLIEALGSRLISRRFGLGKRLGQVNHEIFDKGGRLLLELSPAKGKGVSNGLGDAVHWASRIEFDIG